LLSAIWTRLRSAPLSNAENLAALLVIGIYIAWIGWMSLSRTYLQINTETDFPDPFWSEARWPRGWSKTRHLTGSNWWPASRWSRPRLATVQAVTQRGVQHSRQRGLSAPSLIPTLVAGQHSPQRAVPPFTTPAAVFGVHRQRNSGRAQ
jgi:hypothetical protein